MSKRIYHQGLAQAYRHKALEHASLARAHARNNNAEGVAHHQNGFSQNMQQSSWHESEAELAHGPVDDITGEAYENGPRPSYDPSIESGVSDDWDPPHYSGHRPYGYGEESDAFHQ